MCSIVSRPSVEMTSTGSSLRVRYGTDSRPRARRSAWRADRPRLAPACSMSVLVIGRSMVGAGRIGPWYSRSASPRAGRQAGRSEAARQRARLVERQARPTRGDTVPHVESHTRIGQGIRESRDGDRSLGDHEAVGRQLGRRAGQRGLDRGAARMPGQDRRLRDDLTAGSGESLAQRNVGGAMEQTTGSDRRRRQDRDRMPAFGEVERGPEATPIAQSSRTTIRWPT